MPYIKPELRGKIDDLIEELGSYKLSTGEINYAITKFFHVLIIKNSLLCYDMFNSLIGVLECVKLELYRMVNCPL